MTDLLNTGPNGASPRRGRGCTSILVGSQRFANSAAKFWPTLLDEIPAKYPECERIELTASCGGMLHPKRLYPEQELRDSLAELVHCDLLQVVRDTIAALELFGPPGPVEIRLRGDRREILRSQLPLDSVDAELFPYLLVWLLKWARVQEDCWNDPTLAGRFTARDTRRGIAYEVPFTLENRHLSEGLYRRTLTLLPASDRAE